MLVRSPRYSKEEFARRGDEIYNRDIRSQVETEQNKGKFVAIDIETGTWEMDASEIEAGNRLCQRIPDAQTWMIRVGYGYIRRFRLVQNTQPQKRFTSISAEEAQKWMDDFPQRRDRFVAAIREAKNRDLSK